MTSVTTYAPANLSDALDLLGEYGTDSAPLAGGTDFMVALPRVRVVISLHRIRELSGIHRSGDNLVIGAMTTHDDITGSPEIVRYLPSLNRAAGEIGSPQIRNRGTIGGNLANASPAGDLVPPLFANQAILKLVSNTGERNIPVEKFFTGPGKNVLKPGEIIHSVIIPIPEGIFFQDFIKLGQRRALAIAKINLAISADRLRRNGAGPIKERIRIAMGSVAPTVVRLPKTERLVTGNLHSEKALEKAVRTAAKEVSPIDDIRSSAAYRREMASALVKTALQRLVKFVDEL